MLSQGLVSGLPTPHLGAVLLPFGMLSDLGAFFSYLYPVRTKKGSRFDSQRKTSACLVGQIYLLHEITKTGRDGCLI